MLIILTSERELDNEADRINTLFENGLEVLHLRKPTLSIEGYRALLTQINPTFYDRIMIHQYHELCVEFTLRGVHIQEQPRLDLGKTLENYTLEFIGKSFKVSSSFHSKEAIKECAVDFEYVFLSPVFSSISKVGYEGKGFDVKALDAFVIGMGGIHEETVQATFDLGYKGVGVLGGVWNTVDYLDSFLKIKKAVDVVMLS